MRYRKAFVASTLVFCLFQLSLIQSLQATVRPDASLVKRQVNQFGVGAKVELLLAGGEKLRGSIRAIDGESFTLTPQRRQDDRSIGYGQVSFMRLTKVRYRASGHPDATQARLVVLALGVGKHVVVNDIGGRELHGNIQAIEPGYFTVLPDQKADPVQIAYSDVTHVEKNLSLGATIVLIVLIAAAVVVAASVAATR